ncbi:MAG: Zn-dependent hydrolase [Planctomycetota bacterium]
MSNTKPHSTHDGNASALAELLAGRVMAMCDFVAEHTEVPGEITRRYLTPPTHQVHALIRSWMDELGMDSRIDAVGNLIGHLPAETNDHQAKRLLIGSHIDTVPAGGRYDGVLGVMVGLAAVQCLQGTALPFGVDVIALSEEEGIRFRLPYIGSAALCGCFQPDWLQRTDSQGTSLASAIQQYGLRLSDLDETGYSTDQIIGFLEPHIEQGPLLASVDCPLGVVEAIAGQSRLLVRFTGRAGHAGTTPMQLRHDALVASARWIDQIDDQAKRIDGLRLTVGQCSVSPGARNVIVGQCDLSLDIRHAEDAARIRGVEMAEQLGDSIARANQVEFETLENQSQPASTMDRDLCDAIRRSLRVKGCDEFSLVSGAGHDSAMMSTKFPTAMLFLRQRRGISHHPDEDVDIDDVALAIDVLATTIKQIASENHAS